MADVKEEKLLIDRLHEGEMVLCSKCKNGYFIPFNTSAEKAHSFNCSNPDCNNYINIDTVIDLE